jgi:hypothetical protein
MARALVEISTNEALRGELLTAGRERNALFSSRLSAVKTLSLYRRVFENVFSS